VINNRFTCPYQTNAEGCVGASSQYDGTTEWFSAFGKWFGNEIYDVNTLQASWKLVHSLYLGTDGHDQDIGWNYIHHNVGGCRGIQVHSSPLGTPRWTGNPTGAPLYNITIHDNWITDQPCDGINFGSVDPSLGYVNAYNNVVWNVGLGGGVSSDYNNGTYAGIYFAGLANQPVATTQAGCTWSWTAGSQILTGNGSCNFGVGGDNLQQGWGICFSNGVNDYDACSTAFIQSVDSPTQITLFNLTGAYGCCWDNHSPIVNNFSPIVGYPLVYFKAGRGTLPVYNNTFYSNSNPTPNSQAFVQSGAWGRSPDSPLEVVNFSNNIIYQISGERWSDANTNGVPGNGTYWLTGSNNVFYNPGTVYGGDTLPSSVTTNQQTGNPNFTNTTNNFAITSGSSAIQHGTASPASSADILGFAQTSPVTIGAYTLQGTSGTVSMSISGVTMKGVVIK
jgi:hypothetical protein